MTQNKTQSETDKKNSFILYYDLHDSVSEMTDQEAGTLFKAILHFHAKKEQPPVPESLRFLFLHLLSQFKRDTVKYVETCVKRSIAGRNGAKQKLANAGKSKQIKQKLANQADNDIDNENDSDMKRIELSENLSNPKTEVEKLRKTFVPPKLEDALAWAEKENHDKRLVRQGFEYYQRLGWKDSRGTPVKAWKQKLLAVWLTPEKIADLKPEPQLNRCPSF